MTEGPPTPGQPTTPPEIDTSVPHSARIWNYWLGGKDNYPVDRAAGDQYREVFPEIFDIARASRQFLTCSVRYLAELRGADPAVPGRRHRPADRRQHPRGRPAGRPRRPYRLCRQRSPGTDPRPRPAYQHPYEVTAYIDADLRDPDKILAAAAQDLDFTQPIALMPWESWATSVTTTRHGRSEAAADPAVR